VNYNRYKYLVLSDMYRYGGKKGLKSFLKTILRIEGFKYTFWHRTVSYSGKKMALKYTVYPIARLILSHYGYKFGISIPKITQIDSGFYIGHYGGIVINKRVIIGKNCNISQGVTLGQANRGKRKGTPIIGDNVYMGPGAKIIGNVTIGNNVAIGANCVVTKDILDNSVVVGIPGTVISSDGSEGYVNFTDYDKKLRIKNNE